MLKLTFNKYVLGSFILCVFVGCQQTEKVNFKGMALGTYYSISYMGKEDTTLNHRVDSLISSFEAMASIFDTNSLISKINENQEAILTDDFISIFNISQEVSMLTNGAFDITIGPLVNAWGFGKEKPANVNQSQIDSLKEFVGYQKVSVQKYRIIKTDSRIQLNFNAVAKGYLVDIVAAYIVKNGYSNCLVEIGGEVVSKGDKNGKPWQVGIQIPTTTANGEENIDYIFTLTNQAVATSGNYRRYREENGQRFTHIVNPKTGLTEKNNLLSVTVIAESCAYADALATAFMVMGKEAALEFLKSHPEYAAYFIYDENGSYKHTQTSNFPERSM